jgi:hypothetical protein
MFWGLELGLELGLVFVFVVEMEIVLASSATSALDDDNGGRSPVVEAFLYGSHVHTLAIGSYRFGFFVKRDAATAVVGEGIDENG